MPAGGGWCGSSSHVYLCQQIVVGVEARTEDLQRSLQDVVVRLAAQVVLNVALRLPQDGGDPIQGHQPAAFLTPDRGEGGSLKLTCSCLKGI